MDSLTMAAIVAALLSYQLSVVTGAATGGGPVIPDELPSLFRGHQPVLRLR